MKKILLCGILISIFLIASCQSPQGGTAGMANPASVNCVDNGGELKIKKDAEGNEYGLCILKDGTSCEEWAYFRGECPKEGGTTEKSTLKGPASDNLVFKVVSAEDAPQALIDGSIDMYLGFISPQQAEELKDDSNINIILAPSQYFDLAFNPAPSTEDELNPFSIREIRFALNNLVDKEGLIKDVLMGYGQIKPTYLFEASPDFEIVRDVVEKYDFSYNQDEALKVIDEEMASAGAEKADGIWQYNGKPVTIKYVIYSGGDYGELEEVSDYVALALEDAGFTVEKIYYDLNTVDNPFDSDPAELKWHLRTGTGIYFGFTKFNTYGIIGLAPFSKGLSGSNKEGSWNYENEKLDGVGKKLFYGNYKDENEWKSLFQEGMDVILKEAYKVSLVAKQNIFAARSDIKELTVSDFVGIRLLRNFREAYIPGKETLVIGTKETYNEGDGFSPNWFAGNIYRMDIKMAVRDFGMWSNPKTLEYGTLRWEYEVESAGPDGKLDVPEDAVLWESSEKKWLPVGKGIKATSRVTFDLSKYLGTKWHHGVEISWADVLYQLAQSRERVFNEKWNEITEAQELWLEPYKGYRFDGTNLEIYVDEWHFTDWSIADSAVFAPDPWLLYATTNMMVYEDNSMMYSKSKAGEYEVPVIRLIDENNVDSVLEKINSLEFDDIKQFVTVGDEEYATEDSFNKRKDALNKWAQDNGHLIIGEGPFYFGSFSDADGKVTLKAFRDETYPFKKGDWLIK